jgi:hypothetical protein
MGDAQLYDRLGRGLIDRLAEEMHCARPWTNQAGNGAEGTALPCAVRAEERDNFTLSYMQGKPLQCLDLAIAVADLAHVSQLFNRHVIPNGTYHFPRAIERDHSS